MRVGIYRNEGERCTGRVEGLVSEAAQGVPCKFGAGYHF